MQSISNQDPEVKEARTILLYNSLQLTTFEVTQETKLSMIQQGYQDAKKHIMTYGIKKDPIETSEWFRCMGWTCSFYTICTRGF